MARKVTTDSIVYGGYDGAVAFLDLPEGVMPPPYIGHMVYLGDVPDVITRAVNILIGRQRAVGAGVTQQAIAELLGTRQQHISRWQNGIAAPRLTDRQWADLVKMVIADSEEARQLA